MVLGDGIFRRRLDCEGGVLLNKVRVFIEEIPCTLVVESDSDHTRRKKKSYNVKKLTRIQYNGPSFKIIVIC